MNHHGERTGRGLPEAAGPFAPGWPEEVLVADNRSGVTPAELIERKLVYALHGAPVAGSHVRMGGARACNGRASRPPASRANPAVQRHTHKEQIMRMVEQGDRVQVHYVKLFGDGSVVSSHGRAPLEVTVGIDHPRLPGLGQALVGLAVGESATVAVPAPGAHGPHDPRKIHRLPRARFAGCEPLAVGAWVRLQDRRQRRRLVRIVEVREGVVVIDANRRGVGQSLELEVQVVGRHDAGGASGAADGVGGKAVEPGPSTPEERWLDDGGRP